MIYTLYDMSENGVNVSNSLDFIVGGMSFVPGWGWIVGGTYFIGNMAIEQYSGQNIGQHIESWIK